MADESVQITQVEELVEHLELQKMHTYELVATARDEYEDPDPEDSDSDVVRAGEDQIRVRTAVRARSQGLDYRVEFTVSHMYGQLTADIGAFYGFTAQLKFDANSDDAVIAFGDRVALMAVYPYLRQAIGDLGQRIGVDITLPMLRPGHLSFRPDDEDGEDSDAEAPRST